MRKTLKFSIIIEANKSTVWKTMFTKESYPKWAAVFCGGSEAVTNWEEGSEVEFTSPDGDGMFGIIEQKVENQKMVFQHLGVLRKGQKMDNDESALWRGARESYALKEENENTTVQVSMDTTEALEKYFNETFPKALEKIKQLSEQK